MMIAKRMKNGSKLVERSKLKSTRLNTTFQKINNVTFLFNNIVLRRAEQYLKTKKLAPERRENFGERQNVERKPETKKRENVEHQEGSHINNNKPAQIQKPKQKFVEKVEDTKKQSQPIVVAQQ